jgi:hypothetical protein
METIHRKDMAAMEEKLQVLLRVMLNQSNTGIDMGDLGAFLSTRNDDNNVRHSSTSNVISRLSASVYYPLIMLEELHLWKVSQWKYFMRCQLYTGKVSESF